MENPIKMDDLGIPLFLETPILNFGGVMGFGVVFMFLSVCKKKMLHSRCFWSFFFVKFKYWRF